MSQQDPTSGFEDKDGMRMVRLLLPFNTASLCFLSSTNRMSTSRSSSLHLYHVESDEELRTPSLTKLRSLARQRERFNKKPYTATECQPSSSISNSSSRGRSPSAPSLEYSRFQSSSPVTYFKDSPPEHDCKKQASVSYGSNADNSSQYQALFRAEQYSRQEHRNSQRTPSMQQLKLLCDRRRFSASLGHQTTVDLHSEGVLFELETAGAVADHRERVSSNRNELGHSVGRGIVNENPGLDGREAQRRPSSAIVSHSDSRTDSGPPRPNPIPRSISTPGAQQTPAPMTDGPDDMCDHRMVADTSMHSFIGSIPGTFPVDDELEYRSANISAASATHISEVYSTKKDRVETNPADEHSMEDRNTSDQNCQRELTEHSLNSNKALLEGGSLSKLRRPQSSPNTRTNTQMLSASSLDQTPSEQKGKQQDTNGEQARVSLLPSATPKRRHSTALVDVISLLKRPSKRELTHLKPMSGTDQDVVGRTQPLPASKTTDAEHDLHLERLELGENLNDPLQLQSKNHQNGRDTNHDHVPVKSVAEACNSVYSQETNSTLFRRWLSLLRQLFFFTLFIYLILVPSIFLIPALQIEWYGLNLDPGHALENLDNYGNEGIKRPLQTIYERSAYLASAICVIDDMHCSFRTFSTGREMETWFIQRKERMQSTREFPIACPERPCGSRKGQMTHQQEDEITRALTSLQIIILDIQRVSILLNGQLLERQLAWNNLAGRLATELKTRDCYLLAAAQAIFGIEDHRERFAMSFQIWGWDCFRWLLRRIGRPVQVDRLSQLEAENAQDVDRLIQVKSMTRLIKVNRSHCEHRLSSLISLVLSNTDPESMKETIQTLERVILPACRYLHYSLTVGTETQSLEKWIFEGINNEATLQGRFGESLSGLAALPLIDETGRTIRLHDIIREKTISLLGPRKQRHRLEHMAEDLSSP